MTLPRPSQIIEYMQEGKGYTPSHLAMKFDQPLPQMQRLLGKMCDKGDITLKRPRPGERQYFLPVHIDTEPVKGPERYVPTWKPLDPDWDNHRAFRANCEAIKRY